VVLCLCQTKLSLWLIGGTMLWRRYKGRWRLTGQQYWFTLVGTFGKRGIGEFFYNLTAMPRRVFASDPRGAQHEKSSVWGSPGSLFCLMLNVVSIFESRVFLLRL
jgi:hypothetical protein